MVPAVDVGVQTKFSIASILKSKSAEKAKQKELPTASKLDVAGQTLANTDFSNQDLVKSKASAATLENINFSGANLDESDFRGAIFSEKVELAGASLCGADFRGADLTGAVGLNAAHMRFTIANSATRFPSDIEKTFLNGLVIDDLDRDRLYQCQDGESKMLRADGSRT